MRLNRFSLWLLLLLGAGLALAGCVPPTPPPSPTPWPSPTPVALATEGLTPSPAATPTATPTLTPIPTPTPPTITLSVWENLPEAQLEALGEDVRTFQEEFPYYRVKLHHYNSPEELMVSLTAGEASFDVVLASPVLLNSLWASGQLTPMSALFPPAFIDGFAAITLQGATGDGQVWGLADTAGFHLLLFYNRDLVDIPPASTDELLEVAGGLTRNGRWGLGLNSYDPLWLVPWLAASGGWLVDEAGRPSLNTPAMAEALALYVGWQDKAQGVAPLATYDQVRADFVAGQVAMLIDGEWAITELARNDQLNWGLALLPGLGSAAERQPAGPLVLARYWAVSQTATGDRAPAAAAFLEYVTRPRRQLAWLARFGLLPTSRAALDDPQVISNPALRTSAEQMLAGRSVPLGVNASTLLEAMREPLAGALAGRLTPQQAAEQMQANAEQQ